MTHRNYSGPQRTFEKSPSQKPSSNRPNTLTTTIEIDEDSHSRFLGDHFRSSSVPERGTKDDSEVGWKVHTVLKLELFIDPSYYCVGAMARVSDAPDDSVVVGFRFLRHMQRSSDGIEQETRTGQGQRNSRRQMQHGNWGRTIKVVS